MVYCSLLGNKQRRNRYYAMIGANVSTMAAV
jgi:hypothetical protein